MVNWEEVQKVLFPIKNYEDACNRLKLSFSFQLVQAAFNFTLPALRDYTQRLLGGDSRQRYTGYVEQLAPIMAELHSDGVMDIMELKDHTSSREQLEIFTRHSQVSAPDIARLMKYLIYWVVPSEKYLSGLIRNELDFRRAINVLGEIRIRTNLELLQAGISKEDRKTLASRTGLSVEMITDLVNRADFSRLPWASKATISNIIGSGYGSLSRLAGADPEKLYADFFKYGKLIGKNLKLGNEIENSYRIAKIVPVILQD